VAWHSTHSVTVFIPHHVSQKPRTLTEKVYLARVFHFSPQFLFETCFALWDASCKMCVILSSFYQNWNELDFIKFSIMRFPLVVSCV
jgi:hypothetical protein